VALAEIRGDDPAELAARLSATVGVVEQGLFPAAMVSNVVVARGERVEIRSLR
jgi:ribose 5-phosphate isomerase